MAFEDEDEKMLREHETRISENTHDLKNLRQIVDIKLEQIKGDIGDLRNILKWAGGLIVSLMLSFMAWALLQQYNANEAAKNDLQQQLNLLRTQQEQRRLEQLPPSAPQPAVTTDGVR